jgi:hypothetical protein
MRPTTGVDWLDDIAAKANFPLRMDREAAALALTRLLGDNVSKNTLRRWPVPYKLIGRSARYEVDDLISFARKRIAETPMRKPTPSHPRRARRATAEALPSH